MYDPAPFRLSRPQARALKLGVIVCVIGAVVAYGVAVVVASTYGDWRYVANASLAGSVLLALLGLGLYIRRALALTHQRQLNTLAWLTDPHTEEPPPPDSGAADQAEPEPGAEIPSPRPSADPESAREDERG